MSRFLQLKSFIIIILTGAILHASSLIGQTTIDGFFYSPSLDQTKMVDIYLPPGYYDNPDLYYPVIYYLHGWGGNQNWLSTISSYATQKINNGDIDPVIIVCPSNYSTPFDGSMFMNSPVDGNYEDYMMQDLISWLDTTYRTVPDRKYRSLFGHSMGGYGAFRYGTLYKDKFCGLAANSTPANLEVIISDYQSMIQSENSGPPYSYTYSTGGYFTKMIFLGASVWSPDLNTSQTYVSPQVVQYPFDQQGEIIDTIFDKWAANQVTSLVHNLSPSDSVGILFGCGTSDELYFNVANLALKDTLEDLGLDYQYYSFSGGHTLTTGFKTLALDFLDSLMLSPTTLPEPCTDPSELLASNITINSADLSWTENGSATNWEIALDLAGFNIDTITPVMISTIPTTWSNLIPNTTYDWYVRADCGNGNYSNWSGPNTFTTENDQVTQTIQLTNGWNIHSFDVAPDNPDMMLIHADLINAGHLVKIIDESGGFMQYIEGLGWMNTIGDMQLSEGYYIKVDTTTAISVSGQLNSTSDTIPLTAGWNILGYPIALNQNALDAVQPLIDSGKLIKVINETGGFIQYLDGFGWLNTIGNFQAGEGYYINLTGDADLILNYPQGSGKSSEKQLQPETVLFTKSFVNNPYNPMNIVVQKIEMKGLNMMEGDEIAVYDEDICVGAGVITMNNGKYAAIVIASMDDPTTATKEGYTEGNEIRFKYRNESLQQPIELIAETVSGDSQFKPLGTAVVTLTNQLLKNQEQEKNTRIAIMTYPNPVNDKMTVSYDIPQGYVYAGIIDINGARVEDIVNEFQEAGNHNMSVNVSSLKQGFYVLRVRVVSKDKVHTEFHKFVKL